METSPLTRNNGAENSTKGSRRDKQVISPLFLSLVGWFLAVAFFAPPGNGRGMTRHKERNKERKKEELEHKGKTKLKWFY